MSVIQPAAPALRALDVCLVLMDDHRCEAAMQARVKAGHPQIVSGFTLPKELQMPEDLNSKPCPQVMIWSPATQAGWSSEFCLLLPSAHAHVRSKAAIAHLGSGKLLELGAGPSCIWSPNAHWLHNGSQLVLHQIPDASWAALQPDFPPNGLLVQKRTLALMWCLVDAMSGDILAEAQHPLYMDRWDPANLISLSNDSMPFNLAADEVAVMDLTSLTIRRKLRGPPVPEAVQSSVIVQVSLARASPLPWTDCYWAMCALVFHQNQAACWSHFSILHHPL